MSSTIEYKLEWQRKKRRRFAAEHGFSLSAHYATGGQRQRILERDGYKCVDCGMSDEEHKAKWGPLRPITIDHVSKDRSDNSDANLKTRCLTCHGRKDLIPRLKVQRIPSYRAYITEARASGVTYDKIAAATGFSIAGIYKWCKAWGIA